MKRKVKIAQHKRLTKVSYAPATTLAGFESQVRDCYEVLRRKYGVPEAVKQTARAFDLGEEEIRVIVGLDPAPRTLEDFANL